MSRIGRIPIPVPPGVEVKIADGNKVTVKGPKGQLARTLHPDMRIELNDGMLTVTRPTDSGPHRALHGLTRTLLANMVEGVTNGFRKNLEISGVGYRAQKMGDMLVLQVGYSHPVEIEAPPDISFVVEGINRIGVVGIDKEAVGQVAARIRAVRKPEPYKGKGIRYAGEYIRRKAGKAGRAGGKKK
jgi:large subunit ribosomal protein L6